MVSSATLTGCWPQERSTPFRIFSKLCSLTSPFWSVPGPSPSSSASPTLCEPYPAPLGVVSGARALALFPSL